MANTVLLNISQYERQRAIFRSHRIYERDQEHNLAIERQEKEAAVREERMTFAKRLLNRNRPLDEIAEDTGLLKSEIEKLRAKL